MLFRSAGSQFTHRYMLFSDDKQIDKAVLGSAGWYTFLNNEPFPYGMRNMPIERDRYEWFLSRQVLFILGAKDNDPNHESLNNSRGARKQGANRFDRGTSYFKNIVSFSERSEANSLGDQGHRFRKLRLTAGSLLIPQTRPASAGSVPGCATPCATTRRTG